MQNCYNCIDYCFVKLYSRITKKDGNKMYQREGRLFVIMSVTVTLMLSSFCLPNLNANYSVIKTNKNAFQ